ncbi:hypothetical protein AAFF_G00195200 [Aldrovandia affinis]|uniref:Uncharacterized protein n=1 Tax=Aldrovandia affinis TaxID=143900 RepID=A0AAD7SZN0_9TELE|nr:hypothetical protein AAFF_G00195200 [Aldrovandia affinis]
MTSQVIQLCLNNLPVHLSGLLKAERRGAMLQPRTQATEGRQMNVTVMSLPVLNRTPMKHIPQLIFLHDTEEKVNGSTGTPTRQIAFRQAPSLLTKQKHFLFQLLANTEQNRCLTQMLIVP